VTGLAPTADGKQPVNVVSGQRYSQQFRHSCTLSRFEVKSVSLLQLWATILSHATKA
jgi:hypothetical protein